MQRRTRLTGTLKGFDVPMGLADDLGLLIEMAEDEGDADATEGLAEEFREELAKIEDAVSSLEFKRMLSGEHDKASAIVTINAGAGGREAQDWADMLLRMYLRWAEDHGHQTDVVDTQEGDEGGLKGATVTVEGEFTFGYLKAENGIHRLVRISPFDAQRRRHTSFASVFVYPQLDDDTTIDIDENDLRIDTYRASGAGGQHVNKTSSAVRITHEPTGIVVQCQNERSQHKNRSTALKILAARLQDFERKKRDEKRDVIEKSKMSINFGSQIRSYVLAPYRMVKDHRTGFEVGNADAVLDGALDGFIKAYLLATGGGASTSTSGGPRKV